MTDLSYPSSSSSSSVPAVAAAKGEGEAAASASATKEDSDIIIATTTMMMKKESSPSPTSGSPSVLLPSNNKEDNDTTTSMINNNNNKEEENDEYHKELETSKKKLKCLIDSIKDKSVVDDLINMIINNNNNKGTASSSLTTEEDTTVVIPSAEGLLLQGDMLHSTLLFLNPKDICRCLQVCKQWQTDLDNNNTLWKHVATNLSSPELIKYIENRAAIVAAEVERGLHSTTEKPSEWNYKNIVRGLINKTTTTTTPTAAAEAEAEEDNFDLHLVDKKLSQFILVLDAIDKKTGEVVYSTYSSLGYFDCNYETPTLYLVGDGMFHHPLFEEGDYHEHFDNIRNNVPWDDNRHDPLEDTPLSVMNRITFSIRLFSCDTGLSCRFEFDPRDNPRYVGTNNSSMKSVDVRTDVSWEACNKAGLIRSEKKVTTMGFELEYDIDPVEPTTGNISQQQQQQQQQGVDDENWRRIRHRLNCIYMKVHTDNACLRCDLDGLLYISEGLTWK